MADIQQQSLGLDKTQTQQQQQVPGPMATSGAMTPGNIPSQSRVAAYSTGAQQTPGSGRFTNLQNYISANQQGGQQLGQKIAGQVGSSVDTAQKQATSQASDINAGIQAEKQRLSEASGFANQIGQDPTKITGDQAAAQRFQQLTSGQSNVNALKQLADVAEANAINQYGTVGKNVANLGTEQGRFQLLQQGIKQPSYSTGQQRLDQLFLQTANPQALTQQQQALQNQLNQAQANTKNAYENTTSGINTAFTGANALETQATKAQTKLTNALSGATKAFNEAETAKAAALNNKNIDTQGALDTFFNQGYGKLTDAQKAIIDPILQSGGLTAGTRTYNVLQDPNAYQNYMTGYNAPTATIADVINQQDLARIQSLQQLAGITPDKYTYTQAGTGGTQTGFDTGKLASDIQAQRQALEQQLNRQVTAGGLKYGGGFSAGETYKANLLDLLKYQEGQDFGKGQTSWGTHKVVPIYGTDLVNNTPVNVRGYNAGSVNTAIPTITPWNQQLYTTGYRQDALQDLVNSYLNEINQAGYNQGLGGVTPTRGNQFGVLPGNPSGKLPK
ncbi:MAG: hypothetical protein EBZ95_04845 [Chitinophagia bacterium]|nr:hypothetical protein [Chitinophagia bacterium]